MFSLIQPTSMQVMAAAAEQQKGIFDLLHATIANTLNVPETDILSILERNFPIASRAAEIDGKTVMPDLIIKMHTSDLRILVHGRKLKKELEKAWEVSDLKFSIEIWICWFPIWGHTGLPI